MKFEYLTEEENNMLGKMSKQEQHEFWTKYISRMSNEDRYNWWLNYGDNFRRNLKGQKLDWSIRYEDQFLKKHPNKKNKI